MTRIILLLAAVFAFAVAPAHADKLVMFKNGKAMKIKDVQKDGEWLRLLFDDKNFVAVRMAEVDDIIEAAAGSTTAAPGERVNQLVEGQRGLPSAGAADVVEYGDTGAAAARGRLRAGTLAANPNGRPGLDRGGDEQALREALQKEQQFLQQNGVVENPGQPVLPPGFQPLDPNQLNQARKPFEGRRGLARRPVEVQEGQQQEQQEVDEDDDD